MNKFNFQFLYHFKNNVIEIAIKVQLICMRFPRRPVSKALTFCPGPL
jgi:hypothetical protein